MADISQIKLPDNSVYDIKDTVARTVMTGATSSEAGAQGQVPAPTTSDVDKFLSGDGTWKDGGKPMVVLSYGSSTWQQFIDAYNNNIIVYCRASSNSNPSTGAQTRMAFMAYVNANPPTEVEFQYYRSVSSHSINQQGDQVFVYKLNSSGTWSVTTREASVKIVGGTGLTTTYTTNTVTINGVAATSSAIGFMSSEDKTKLDGIDTNANNYTHPSYTSAAEGLYRITVDDTGHVSSTTAVSKTDITDLGIPSSDTTYTAFTGADGTSSGAIGLVPAPLATDNTKFLKGDGTWETISAGSTYTSFTGATSSTDGTSGLVPAPTSSDYMSVLGGDGTWIITATDAEIDAIFTTNHSANGVYF